MIARMLAKAGAEADVPPTIVISPSEMSRTFAPIAATSGYARLAFCQQSFIELREYNNVPNGVVDTTISAKAAALVASLVVQRLVSFEAGWVGGHILLHDSLLVRRLGVDVAESTTAVEATGVLVSFGNSLLGVLEDVGVGWKVGRADSQYVRASNRELRCEDVVLGRFVGGVAEAEVTVTGAEGNTRVTGGGNDSDSLHAELHDFVALAALVVDGHAVFGAAVGDGDDVGGCVHATLELALVATLLWVRVRWVNRGVASLVERRVSAVRSINGIEEVVQETVVCVVGLGGLVICLEQDWYAWVDERNGDGKIQDRLQTSIRLSDRARGTIYSVLSRTEALGNVQSGLLVELVKILLIPDIVEILEDTELAGPGSVDSGVAWGRDVVQSGYTLRSNVDVAQGEVFGVD